MKLSHCKLLRKQQLRLLEYFMLEVTARSAADIKHLNILKRHPFGFRTAFELVVM